MLLKTIKAAHLEARISKADRKSILLGTLVGEIETSCKRVGVTDPSDEEVIAVLRKFEKNLVENIKVYTERSMEAHTILAKNELEIITQFLPAKLTDLQVEKDIGSLNLPKDTKSLGAIVKTLKEKYGTQFEGGQVSKVFKQMCL